MKILSIDYGQKKIGVAVSDETLLVTSPLATIRVNNESEILPRVSKLIDEHKITSILLGMPSGWKNIDSPQTQKVKAFKTKLEKLTELVVTPWDESYSSKLTEKHLVGKQKQNSDSYAAALILQEYLDYLRYEKKSI